MTQADIIKQQARDREADAFGSLLASLAGIVTFIGAWIYCSLTYGFLLGFGLGWLPAAILALFASAIVKYLWPAFLALLFFGLVAVVFS